MKKGQRLKTLSLVTGMMLLSCHGLAMAIDLGSAEYFESAARRTPARLHRAIFDCGGLTLTPVRQETLNTDSCFSGAILPLTSNSMDAGITDMGGLLAQNGFTPFDHNADVAPEASTVVHLLALGLVVLLATRRRIPACR